MPWKLEKPMLALQMSQIVTTSVNLGLGLIVFASRNFEFFK